MHIQIVHMHDLCCPVGFLSCDVLWHIVSCCIESDAVCCVAPCSTAQRHMAKYLIWTLSLLNVFGYSCVMRCCTASHLVWMWMNH